MARVLALALVAAGAAYGAQGSGVPDAEELAALIQNRYDGIGDFSADFVHTYEGGVLRRTVTERGTVLVKKPGMMRWTYTSPEEKVFVSDGVKIYSYVPADRQVIVSTMPEEDRATTAVLFLTGKGHLLRDFTVSYAEPVEPGAGVYVLSLEPRGPDREYERLILRIDRQTLQIRGLSAIDHQGGRSTFEFSNLKENVGLSDSMFVFEMPRGVDVIIDGVISG